MSYLTRPSALNSNHRSGKFNRGASRREVQKTGRVYGTENLTYPIDMGIDAGPELDNHVIFDIFFDESSAFQLDGKKGEPKAWKGHTSLISPALGKAGDELGSTIVKGVNNFIGGDKADNAEEPGVVEKTAKKAFASTTKFTSGMFAGARNLKKLNSSIALAVPQTMTSTSAANYTETKLGAIAGAIGRVATSNTGGEDGATLAGQTARLVMEGVAQIPEMFGVNLNNIMEVTTRRVSNPHIEQRFESVAFREFSFVYDMAARSEAEAIAIDNIIKTFRFHMHPELIKSGLFYDYPSLFDISLMFKDEENKFLQKISSCYLTSFTTNYTSSGVFSTLRNGMPTEVQITMNFREIEPLHKHRIAEGF